MLDQLPNLSDTRALVNFRYAVKYDKPNSELYEFKGKIQIENVE